jgi:hypothetical protein
MKLYVVLCSLVLLILTGCASTEITSHETYMTDNIPQPNHIYVHDFAVTPADVPAYSSLAGRLSQDSPPETPEEIAAGRELAAQIAAQLVEQIRDMGLPAERGPTGTPLQINDIVLRGYILSIEEGSGIQRVIIGFRQGVSELKTAVEGYRATPQGLIKLGLARVESSGAKTPGVAAPAAVALATESPIGLIVGGALRIGGEVTGRSTIEGRAKQSAKEIANVLQKRFEQLGWIK